MTGEQLAATIAFGVFTLGLLGYLALAIRRDRREQESA